MAQTLVVIDYAETRRDKLATLLPALQRTASPANRIRVLLLVRSAPAGQDWTKALRTGDDELDVVLDEVGPQIILEGAAWDLDSREKLYRDSWTAFVERLKDAGGASPEFAPPLPDLTAERFGNPLLVTASAYLAVNDQKRTLPDTWEGLLEGILTHEASYWARVHPTKDSDGSVTRRVAAMAALAGAESETEGAALLHHVPDLQGEAIGVRMFWARWYGDFYRGWGPRFWNPLEPDLLGEHLVATTLKDFPATLAASVSPTRGPNTAQPLTVIARIATTNRSVGAYPSFNVASAHALEDILPSITRAAVDEALNPITGLPDRPTIASALAQAVNSLSPHLGDVTEPLTILPRRTIPRLSVLALALTQHQVSWLRSLTAPSTADISRLASSLDALSYCLRDVGDPEGALKASREAVLRYRGPAEVNPAAYAPGLAKALNNLSVSFMETGNHSMALHAIRDAVERYRDLAEADAETYTPYLASSLNTLCGCLFDINDRQGALEAVSEAVILFQGLAEADAGYAPDLAKSLNNLSSCLAGTGERGGALGAINKAVEMYQGLAESDPATHNPDLAMCMNNLAMCLSETGDPDGALNAARRAVSIRQALADKHPAAYASDFAASLDTLSRCLADKGERGEALDAARKAVAFYRDMATAQPAAYAPALARSLNNLSLRLTDTGDHAEALEVITDAYMMLLTMAGTQPAAYNPLLITTMQNLSICLANTGKHEEARNVLYMARIRGAGTA
ncbi:Tetratricopeptide repeat-containing protein [Arthrobacter sp. ok909]|uniref:tetratricopeptide repeat protein n=1 Tax=Arthrobacter sp. ok909 TaxID=1761746 RepID=UPI0008839397|nr:tetratricopeptide repeat protein [Arthrobacter sp. ok909]SDP44528.1 Tetratricopeptide repeat-containing protein [Arthrobacter sp. ok909]